MSPTAPRHVYRLKLADEGRALGSEIEFAADSPDVALRMAHQYCGSRATELFEDGRKLAELQYVDGGGFWLVG